MKLEVEIKLDPELKVLTKRLVESVRDLTMIVAPLTGFRVLPDEEEDNTD